MGPQGPITFGTAHSAHTFSNLSPVTYSRLSLPSFFFSRKPRQQPCNLTGKLIQRHVVLGNTYTTIVLSSQVGVFKMKGTKLYEASLKDEKPLVEELEYLNEFCFDMVLHSLPSSVKLPSTC